MKKILIVFILFLCSCNSDNLQLFSTQMIKGKISSKTEGHIGRQSQLPTIFVQSPTNTVEVEIPFEFISDYKVGDSCTLIVQKFKIIHQ